MKNHLLYIFLFFSLLCSAQTIKIDKGIDRKAIGDSVSIFLDPTNTWNYEEVVDSANFEPSDAAVPNFGIFEGAVWFKIRVQNTSNESLFLEVGSPIIDSIFFYDPIHDSVVLQGDAFPFRERYRDFNHFLFELPFRADSVQTFYLKMSSSGQLQVPLYIGTISAMEHVDHVINNALFFFFGLMTVMILYNLFLYFVVRDKSYLFYVLYITILMVTQLVPQGFAYQYFWPQSPQFAQYSMLVFPIAVGVTGIFFFNSFLQTWKYLPKFRYVFRTLFVFYSIVLILLIVGALQIAYALVDLTAMLVSLSMLLGAVLIYRKGNRAALFFLIAWSIFLTGIIFWVLKDAGIVPHNNFTNYLMIIGAGLETILLSIGLADRINTLRKEKEAARKNEIHALQENKRIISKQNVLLEEKVQARTKELAQVNTELQSAMDSMMETQEKLIESEKMASLGQLTAGVAHEINNPINFVTSNIDPLRRDIADIIDLLEKYRALSPENIGKKIQEVRDFEAEIELPYLKDELDSIISNISEGAERTSEIVKGLKFFARDHKGDKSSMAINEGIESTITVLQNKLEDIEIVRHFGAVPNGLFYAGKLNQVFLNLLSNSIDAIQARKDAHESGKIEIITSHDEQNDEIKLIFRDNGIGVPEDVRQKMYDPFFTTKSVGKGTGLGLSIVYQIIDLHQGSIHFENNEAGGATFTIHLPVHQ